LETIHPKRNSRGGIVTIFFGNAFCTGDYGLLVALEMEHQRAEAIRPGEIRRVLKELVSRTSAQCHQSARSPRDRAIRGQVEPQSQLYSRQVERAFTYRDINRLGWTAAVTAIPAVGLTAEAPPGAVPFLQLG
jgi:hypothetical protein